MKRLLRDIRAELVGLFVERAGRPITQTLTTLNSDNTPTELTYTTSFSYDTKGRLTQIDGPLAGSDDVTQLTYHTPNGTFRDDFLFEFKRKKNTTTFLVSSATVYDSWGNPTTLVDVDTTLTCLAFSTDRNRLSSRREMMAGQTSCGSPNAADLVTSWARDSALRLVQITRPDGSCMFYEYDSKGRLQRTKRRDDCNAGSAGDRQEFVYDQEGLVTEIQTYDSAGTLTAKQPFTYFDSRRLEKVINPVDTSKWTGISYDPRGLVSQIDGAGNIGKTVFNRTDAAGADGRVTSVDKYKTPTAADTWNLLYSWLGAQASVTDGDAKTTTTVRDDLGRVVRFTSPDKNPTYPTVHLFDSASRRIATKEQYGGATPRTHAFSFDNLGRPLDDDYATNNVLYGSCPAASIHPAETQRIYDAPPTCAIPGGVCSNTNGRLAYVKRRLLCDGSGDDRAMFRHTYYSYDAAGRVIREYSVDDGGRVTNQQYTWTKNGGLETFTTPSGAVIGWSYGSGGHNSDKDRVTSVWRTNSGTPIANSVLWEPYGPLKQYNHQNSYGGVGLRTRISHNLAYRTTATRVETQTGGTTLHSVVVAEDAKGRVTQRDYTPNTGGVQDSYFLYDDQDRLLCETTTSKTTCPTSGSDIKNSHVLSPPFTNAGDWKELLRPMPGVTGNVLHKFNSGGYGTSHRITQVDQATGSPTFGPTNYTFHPVYDGNRLDEYNATLGINNYRWFDYDNENNLTRAGNFLYLPPSWVQFDQVSAFNHDHQRVFKTYRAVASGETLGWFMSYDPFGRVTEVQYFPRVNIPGTYQLFQLIWIGDRLVGYWQTDMPGGVTSKRYVGTDETGRPIDMLSWPSSGDATREWSINPSAWGEMEKAGHFQPLLFAGQYLDDETVALQSDGSTTHRPGLVWNGYRTYDPFTGGYLQVDPLVATEWTSYVYASSNPVGRHDRYGLAVNRGGCMFELEEMTLDQAAACFQDWSGGGGGGGAGGGGGGAGNGGGGDTRPPWVAGGTCFDASCRNPWDRPEDGSWALPLGPCGGFLNPCPDDAQDWDVDQPYAPQRNCRDCKTRCGRSFGKQPRKRCPMWPVPGGGEIEVCDPDEPVVQDDSLRTCLDQCNITFGCSAP